MGIFDAIKRMLGQAPAPQPECPRCGFSYRWNGRRCLHCDYPNPQAVRRQNPTAPTGQPAQTTPSNMPVIPRPTFSPSGNLQNRTQPRAYTPITRGPDKPLDGLETDKFVPLSADEALEMIQRHGGITSAYFDSTNVIPSPDLPRIQIIDRTMVGLGLISGEELDHIHQVGVDMDQRRGDHRTVARRGEAAVHQSREERAAIRQQKKEEAARKRQAHAEAVARRRATDIVFLGRGVSGGLADRRSNVEQLQALNLPTLSTPADVAAAMGIAIPKLRFLAFHSEAPTRVHYISFTVPKKSGGQRTLAAPHTQLAAAQHWILENILNLLPVHDAAHGFVSGRSTVTGAAIHTGQDIVANADLTDFFPTVTFPRVRGLFTALGYSPAVATILGLLCTECPRREVTYGGQTYHAAIGRRALPQGACTSPALSNAVARRLDARLSGIADKLGWKYTRYADDMTLSASGETARQIGYVLARLRHICDDEGFAVNEAKTRIQRRNSRQMVTGLVVNDSLNVPRPTVRRIRAILHRAKTEGLAAQNRDEHPHFEAWLQGMIAYIQMVNPKQGLKLRTAFRELKSD